MIKRIINWFRNSPVHQDNRSELLDVVVKELREIQDVDPDASAEVIRLSDVLAGRQQPESTDDEIEGPITKAWRENQLAHEESAKAYGSGR